jgi:uncharacterized protein
MLAVAVILAVAIGLSLGLLGGGGSILTLPILVHVVGVDAKRGIAMSLFVVATTSLVSMLTHARSGNVRWGMAGMFGVAGMAGAALGSRVSVRLPGNVLLASFTAVMFVTSLAMMRPRKGDGEANKPSVVRALFAGAAVGVVAGLVGAGGGFLVVPALALFGGLPMKQAIGTSLMVIAMQSFAGFAVHLSHTAVDWQVMLAITGAAMAGSFPGAWLAKRTQPATLRKWFGWFVFAMAVFMLSKQASPAVSSIAAALGLVAAYLVTRQRAASDTVLPSTVSSSTESV